VLKKFGLGLVGVFFDDALLIKVMSEIFYAGE
jgi:hypothetical protein